LFPAVHGILHRRTGPRCAGRVVSTARVVPGSRSGHAAFEDPEEHGDLESDEREPDEHPHTVHGLPPFAIPLHVHTRNAFPASLTGDMGPRRNISAMRALH